MQTCSALQNDDLPPASSCCGTGRRLGRARLVLAYARLFVDTYEIALIFLPVKPSSTTELVAILFVASSVTAGFAQNKRTDLASNQSGVAPSSTKDWRAS
jgi:hypothetical protein